MLYADWVNTVSTAITWPASDSGFVALLPAAIDYAEGRIYADPMFDFLHNRTSSNSTCTPLSRNVTKPTEIDIVEAVNLITPVGYSPDTVGSTRVPLARFSLAYLDAVWAAGAGTTSVGTPACYAPLSDTAWRLGPAPDTAYVLEWLGQVVPVPLSPVNDSTFLTLYLPEVFVAASMVFLTGALVKNFGAQMDNPQQAQSWENQFQLLKTGRQVQEARRKAQGANWTAYPPAAIASQPR